MLSIHVYDNEFKTQNSLLQTANNISINFECVRAGSTVDLRPAAIIIGFHEFQYLFM